MPDTNIIEFQKTATAASPSVGTGDYCVSGTPDAVAATRGMSNHVSGSAAFMPIEIDKLYPADRDYMPDLIAALALLAESIEWLEKARAARKKEATTADRCWQRFQSLLPGLFTHRKIGDGFGALINAIHFASVNQHGMPLSFEQLTTVWRVIKALRSAPVISFELAIKYVQELEDCGLKIYPETISELIEDSEE